MISNTHRNWGVRHLQLARNVSLDQIICDPDLAEQFDKYASRLAPGYTSLQYRWVALGLRKAGRLHTKMAEVDMPTLSLVCNIKHLKASSIPNDCGLYLFSSENNPVFLSQTDDIRHRIERHMEVSNSRGLPDWLWDKGSLNLSIAAMPGIHRASRQFFELSLVKQLHPVLNYQRAAA